MNTTLNTSIQVIFYKGRGGLYSRLIRWFKRTKYTHCEIRFNDGYCGTSDAPKGGVVYYYMGQVNTNDWDVITIPCTSEEEIAIRKIFTEEELNCGYDWLGIILCQIFPWGRQHSQKWFCSEICTYALQKIKSCQAVCCLKPYQIHPGKLFDILKPHFK